MTWNMGGILWKKIPHNKNELKFQESFGRGGETV